jgi:hypothetical protein
VVHEWKTGHTPGAATYLLDDGHLLRCGQEPDNPRFRGGGIGGRIQELDWDGNVVWDFLLFGDDRTQHHDIEVLPDGNILMIAWEYHGTEEAVAHGRDPEHGGERGLWPDVVVEVRPTPPEGGELVWEWRAWDHLVQDRDPSLPNYGDIAAFPGRIDINFDHRDAPPETAEQRRQREELEEQMRALGYIGGDEPEESAEAEDGGDQRRRGGDWMHTNSIDYLPEHDLIVLSSPRLDEIWIIDHSTTTEQAAGTTGGRFGRGGEILWRWGNPKNHGAGEDSDQQLFAQHDATFVGGQAPGELRVLVFNNGGGRPGGDLSSVDELLLPFDPQTGFPSEPGAPFGPAEPAWSYEDPGRFYSAFISGAQRLPSGNTLICSGAPGRAFEVTREGQIVWEYRNPLGGEVEPTEQGGNAPPKALFRATRIPRDHPGLVGKL